MVIARIIGEIAAQDWDSVAPVVDGAIGECGQIKLLLDAQDFDGWQDMAAARAHFSFVKAHHRSVERVAIITARQWQHWLAGLARLFVAAELKAFEPQHRSAAQDWLATGELQQISVSIESAEQDHVLLVRVKGQLRPEDYRSVLLPVISSALEAQDKLSFMVDLTELVNADMDRLQADLAARLEHARQIERIAVVGDVAWVERARLLSAALPLIEVRAFLPSQWQHARHWVTA